MGFEVPHPHPDSIPYHPALPTQHQPFLQCFERIKYPPASGPLHLLFSPPEMLFWVFTGFNFNVTSSFLVTPSKTAACPYPPSCLSSSLSSTPFVLLTEHVSLLKTISHFALLIVYCISPHKQNVSPWDRVWFRSLLNPQHPAQQGLHRGE